MQFIFSTAISFKILIKASAPMGALKCYFPPIKGIMTDHPTDRLTNEWTDQGWEFIKENKKVNKKVTTHASTKKRTRYNNGQESSKMKHRK